MNNIAQTRTRLETLLSAQYLLPAKFHEHLIAVSRAVPARRDNRTFNISEPKRTQHSVPSQTTGAPQPPPPHFI